MMFVITFVIIVGPGECVGFGAAHGSRWQGKLDKYINNF